MEVCLKLVTYLNPGFFFLEAILMQIGFNEIAVNYGVYMFRQVLGSLCVCIGKTARSNVYVVGKIIPLWTLIVG